MASGPILAQLERMLDRRFFVVRPRMASLLRFFVEESLRQDGGPIAQQAIATHALSLPDGFQPTKSSYVRTQVTRLRQAVIDYYDTVGRDDPIIFSVTPGPYRLVVTEARGLAPAPGVEAAGGSEPTRQMKRRHRPSLLFLEPDDGGCLARHQGIGPLVALHLASALVDCPFVSASGPLRRSRLTAEGASLEHVAAELGYDFACALALDSSGDSGLTCSTTIDDVRGGRRILDETTTVQAADDDPAAAGVANWIVHRISQTFMSLRLDTGIEPHGDEPA
jgi:hypothetical protein